MITTCNHCGKVIRKRPAVIENQKHVFCSQSCAGKFIGNQRLNKKYKQDIAARNKIRWLAKMYKARTDIK